MTTPQADLTNRELQIIRSSLKDRVLSLRASAAKAEDPGYRSAVRHLLSDTEETLRKVEAMTVVPTDDL